MAVKNPTLREWMANDFLAALNEGDRDFLSPHLTVLDLEKGTVLHESVRKPRHTWFPCGAALASYLLTDRDGKTTEVALIGREGMIGGLTTDGHGCTFPVARVRTGGRFLRIDNSALEEAREARQNIRRWLARYADCLVAQVFQEIACSKTHSVIERAAKWLLDAQMRTGAQEFPMTQEDLAHLLGVGRTFVNRVAGELRQQNLIETRRGVIRIRDEAALRQRSCVCHNTVSGHFKSMFAAEPSACQ
ncbi:MAG: Crp/Fnr family transcriptional regulator [Beijerinckiaceae bacterium]